MHSGRGADVGVTAEARAQSGTIDVGDARIYYEVGGQGQAVVFIHGWALNLREWDDKMSALAPRYRVVLYDRRGLGNSTGFGDVSADPGDLEELLDTFGITSAVLVGNRRGKRGVPLRCRVSEAGRLLVM